MPVTTITAQDDLASQLTDRFGPLLTQSQLAELLGRSAGGLRYSLCTPSDARTRALKACGRRIGRRGLRSGQSEAGVVPRDTHRPLATRGRSDSATALTECQKHLPDSDALSNEKGNEGSSYGSPESGGRGKGGYTSGRC